MPTVNVGTNEKPDHTFSEGSNISIATLYIMIRKTIYMKWKQGGSKDGALLTSHSKANRVIHTWKKSSRPKIQPEILLILNLWRKSGCWTLSKALDISSAKAQAQVAPKRLQALAILSNTTIKQSAVEQEDLKLYWKLENRPDFWMWSTRILLTSFWKILLSAKRGLKRLNFLATDLSPAFLKLGMSDETLQNLAKILF